jgi:shikimate kinase
VNALLVRAASAGIRNLQTRGVVMEPDQTVRGLYDHRQDLHRPYARLTIDCTGKNHDQVVTEIIEKLSQ